MTPRPAPPDWSARGALWLGYVTIALLLLGFGGWGALTHIQGAIVAPGQIEVDKNRQVIQHPDGGVIASLHVTEGQRVAAGDLLLRLDGSALQSEMAIVQGQLVELQARRARLEAERDDAPTVSIPPDLTASARKNPDTAEQIDGQVKLFAARLDTHTRQIEQLQRRAEQTGAETQGIDAQITAVGLQLVSVQQELTDQKGLRDRGLAQTSRVLVLQREEARLMGEAGALTASRAANEGRKTEIGLEILRLAAARREEASQQLRDIGSQELELAERNRALAERIDRLDIRAPVAGVVLGLQLTTPRAVLRAAEPVLSIVPQDRPLVIQAQISPLHIDEVHVGQRVRLVFPAFSARTTPELFGTVALVSPDALTQESTGQTYYRAEIVLAEGEMAKISDQTLLPGMPVEAFIQTTDRTPLAYLLKPFTDYFGRAFRET
ncbi:MAG: RTX toxin [Bradyrhizobium sp. PARBB1]|nr:MAG: RTX toxin [Bradyrhizobium sp. PARBB1]